MTSESRVVQLPLRDKNDELSTELQDELYAVICQVKYDHMKLSTTVGVLEFLKWNLINRSD